MKMKMIIQLALAALPFSSVFAQGVASQSQRETLQKIGNTILYKENKGQVVDTDGNQHDEILFTSYSDGVRTYFKNDGISYVFEKHNAPKMKMPSEGDNASTDLRDFEQRMKSYTVEMHRIDLNLIGANPNAQIKKEQVDKVFDNYYLGHVQVDHVNSYGKVTYVDIYPNIDMVLYTKDGGMKYDFIVRPGGNPSMIQMEIEGTDKFELNKEGQLILGSHLGKIIEGKPLVLQNGKEVLSNYRLNGNKLSFNIENYNESETLTIDPTREWGTYFTANGGQEWSFGQAIDANANGAYWIFCTTAGAFPAAAGVFDPTYNGDWDLQMAHFNTAGGLVYNMYLGGATRETFNDIAVNETGQFVISTCTNSNNYPILNAWDGSYNGGYDFGISQFNSADGTLNYSTYLGGTGDEYYSTAVDINALGEVIFVGGYCTNTVPLVSPFDGTYNGAELLIARFDGLGNIVRSSYLDGIAGSAKYVSRGGVKFMPNGDIAVLSNTTGNTFTATSGVFDQTYNGNSDYFLHRLQSDLSGVVFGTWIGNGDQDGLDFYGDREFCGLAICSDNSVIVGGTNFGGGDVTWAATPGAYSTVNVSGGIKSYIIKFNSTGQRLWGTTWGNGTGHLWLNDVAVDASDNVFICGGASSAGMPTTVDMHQSYIGGWERHIAQLSADGSSLLYGTYLGTANYEMPEIGSLAFANGSLYTALFTNDNAGISSQIVSAGAHQTNPIGTQYYPVLNKFQFTACVPTVITPNVATLPAVNEECSANPTAPTATNDCGDVLTGTPDLTLPITSQGSFTITWTYDDGVNTLTQTQDVTVDDVTDPVIVCPSNVAVNTDLGICGATVNYSIPTATDNCVAPLITIPGYTYYQTVGNIAYYTSDAVIPASSQDAQQTFVSGFGANLLSIDDAAENALMVTIQSLFGAIVIPMNDAAVEGTFVWANGNPVVYTNWQPGEPNNVGNEDYVQLVSGPNQWNDAGSFNGIYVVEYDISQATVTQTDVTGLTSGDVFPIGTTTLEYTATDIAGNTDVCTFNVTVTDTENPTITCATPAASYSTDLGVCTFMLTDNSLDPTAFADNCPGASVENDYTNSATLNGATFPIGSTTVTWTVTDAAGNTTTCQYNVVVADNELPTITCATPAASYNADAGVCAYSNSGTLLDPVASGDNCSLASVLNDFNASNTLDGEAFPVGSTTVIWTATDASGNTATCNTTIVVIDIENPVITCPGDVAVNNDPGVCGATVNYTIPTATDNCGGGASNILFVSDVNAGTEIATSLTSQGYTVTSVLNDYSGGNNATLQGSLAGYDVIYWHAVGGGSGDVHNAATFTNLNTFVAAGGSVFVTGYDVIASPVDPNLYTFVGGTGSVDVPPGGGTGVVLGPPNSLNDGFSNIIGLTLANPGDHDALTGLLPGCVTVAANGSGADWALYNTGGGDIAWVSSGQNTGAFPAWTTPGSGYYEAVLNFAFNASGTGTTVTQTDVTGLTSGDVFPVGTTTLEYTATDNAGNTDVCTFNVTVTDTENPTITCATPAASYATDPGVCTFTIADNSLDPTAFADNCPGSTIENDYTNSATLNGANFPIGSTTVTWTVTDAVGNTATCQYDVVVTDNELPTITCATPAASYNADAGVCTYTNSGILLDPVASGDNCSITSVLNNYNASNTLDGATFPVGSTTVIWTVTDGNGNVATCSNSIVVVDAEAPTAICQDITVPLGASGSVSIVPGQIDNGSFDNCSLGGLGVTPNNFTCSNLGNNTVTLTVLDNAGNSSTCTSTITIIDNTVPNAICQDITVQLDASGNATITGADIDNGSTDNCSISTLVANPNTFTCADAGSTVPVTLTVTDGSGNSSTCVSNVTVQDAVTPTAVCQNITVVLDATGNYTMAANEIDNGSSDACGAVTLAASITAFDCSMTGDNTVTLTVTDASGNSATCNATVTVVDNENPVITCPGDVTLSNDAGVCGAIVNYTVPTATDNCGGTPVELLLNGSFETGLTSWNFVNNPSPFGGGWQSGASFSPWPTFGPITPTDGGIVAGNGFDGGAGTAYLYQDIFIPSSGATLTWDDQLDYDLLNYCGGCLDRLYQVQVRDLSNVVIGTIYSQVASAGTLVNGGWQSHTFDLSAYAGQTIRLTFFQNIPQSSTGPGQYGIDNVSVMSNGSMVIAQTDATGLTSGDVFPIGTTTIEYTATDDSGNTDVCTFDVTVSDNEAPNVVCQPITVQLDASGNATITATDVDGGSTDNCGIATSTIDISAFTCANLGANNVTLTVEDIYGNSASCVAVVIVVDNIAPTAICQDITVALDGTGSYTMLPTDIDNGSNDACGIASYAASQTMFTCADVGIVPVTLQVTDNNGNSSTCVANVTVVDNVPPTAICAAGPVVLALDASGNLTVFGSDIDGGSMDNCGIASLDVSPNVFTCADIGIQNVTLTVTDVNGNTATCNTTIDVQDQTAPVITCPSDITVNAIVNNCGRTVTYNFNVSDACATITQIDGTGLTSGSLFPVGTTVQTYEVTDQTGTYTCSFNVTVNDIQNPVITNCPSNIVVSNDAGRCDARVMWTEPIASDNCPAVSFTSTHSPGDVFPLGTTTVTYTATDASGNFVTCTFDVTVNDNESPVIASCTPNITVSNDAGVCGAIVNFTPPVFTENCSMGTVVSSQASGTLFPIGTTTVTWTLTDNAGNISTCAFDVTVNDTELPIAACSNITVQLDATGSATIVAGDIDGGSTDNCGVASITASQTSFDCTNVGANNVTLTVLDVNGNTATCNAVVTIEDNVAPTANCTPITVQLDASGNVSIAGSDIDAGSNDACGIASLVATPNTFTCANIGANTVTLTVTDNNGNVSTCTSTVTVQDNVAPTAICQDIVVQLDAAGSATIATTDIDNGSNDACGIASMSLDVTSFDCTNVGANTVTLTVTDNNGNVSTCTSTVTVQDNVAPTAICQDILVQLDAAGSATIATTDIDNGSNDACGIASMSLDVTSFDCSNVGANTVTLTVTDNNGNVSTCTSTVTVQDNVAPTAICQDITVQLDAAGSATIAPTDIDNGSNDACGIASMSLDVTSFDCSNVGANTVTLTVTDNNGNVSTCTSTVTVQDNVAPTAICQDITINLDATGNYTMLPSEIDGGSNDACGIASITASQTSFTCADVTVGFVGTPVTLTVTDNNGNVSTCVAEVFIVDNTAPTAICQDIVVQLDAAGSATIATTDIDNGSNDACGIASMSLDVTSFDCSNVGANTVTLTVTDNNGNVSTCTSTVTVQDNVAPTAICQDIVVQLDAAGSATIATTDIDNGSNDACGIASMSLDVTSFDCSNVGANTVTLTVTDNNGNVSTCTSTVTVQDNVAPTAICQDITVQLDAAGSATIATTDIDNGSNDACGIASMTLDVTSFDCSNVGANTVTLTITDNNGNVSTCTSTVTVQDNVAPTAICQDIIVQLDAAGSAAIATTDIDNGSNDACGIASMTLDVTSFDCSNVGANTVTLTVTDNNGNVSTCTSTVTVQDNVAPTAICQDITVQLDAAGSATIATTDIDNGSNDACGIASMTLDVTSFDCSNVGANTVTLTVTDNNGNVSTCTSTVTVEDVQAPVISCLGNVLVSNDPGLCTASSVAIGTATAVDNCSAFVVITNDAPAVYPFGVTNVTWTATDGFGNTSTCVQTVTVEDVENPIITCPAPVVVNTDAGSCSATGVTLGSPVTSDNCTIASVTNDAPGVFPLGVTNVTWTVTDVQGNTATCTQTVTVQDMEVPVITCPVDVTVGTNPGVCAASGVALGSPIVTDNCTIASVTNNAPGIFPLGTTTVTWTVTDAAGNTATCNQIVTVVDNINPIISCPADIVVNSTAGICGATGVTLGSPITNDNCSVASVTNDAPAVFPLGETDVTWTVTDAAGNTAECIQLVTVIDVESPMITCPSNVIVSADAGSCNASSVVLGTPTSSDNCSVASVTNDAPATFPLGNTIVTWTATDAAGNSSTCTQQVTVTDNESPIMTCPADVIVSANGGTCSATLVALGSPVVSDNCAMGTVTNDAPGTYPLGNTTVTWTAIDAAGNMTTCTQIVTVIDTEAPSIACPGDVIVSADAGSCEATNVILGNATASDNCTVASVTNDAPVAFPLGMTMVTWTVTDAAGNTSTCTQMVTVNDTEVPVITCPANVIVSADAGSCDATAVTLGTPLTSDNCSIATVSNDAPAVYPLGNTTVTWTVVDASGNTSTCTQLVTVEDNEVPTIVCPSDISITADAGVCGSTMVILGTPVTGDNCSVATTVNDAPAFFPVGVTTVTWTVTDGSGNTASCTQQVTVTDDELPVIVSCAADITVNADAGSCNATGVTLTPPNATDNCSVASITNDAPATFTAGTTTVTWTVVDASGNSVTCTQLVTVVDGEAPVITCPTNITVNNTPGFCGATVSYGTPVATDNCGVASVSQTDGVGYTSGNLFPIGTTTQEYTVIDISGNSSVCSFDITVIDAEAPMITGCPADMTVMTNEPNQCMVKVDWTQPQATDNCPGTVISQDHFSGEEFPFGTTTVTYTATDNAGNVTTCSFNITVIDVVNPTVTLNADGVTLSADNQGTSYQWIDCATGNPVVGAINETFTPTANGSYAVIIDDNGCVDTSSCQVVSTVGIGDITFENLVIYPNPSMTGVFKIKYSGEIKQIEVFDMVGRVIMLPIDLNEKIIDGSELASGKYMLRLYTEKGITVTEVVINR